MAFRQIIQSSKQLFAPDTYFGQWYLATAKKHPFPTAFFTSGIKTSLADIIAQKVCSRVLSLLHCQSSDIYRPCGGDKVISGVDQHMHDLHAFVATGCREERGL